MSIIHVQTKHDSAIKRSIVDHTSKKRALGWEVRRPDFFSLLQLFFPELGTDEKKFWECNAAKKKGRGQGRLPTSNFKQVDA
jgi:hypothetical protein